MLVTPIIPDIDGTEEEFHRSLNIMLRSSDKK